MSDATEAPADKLGRRRVCSAHRFTANAGTLLTLMQAILAENPFGVILLDEQLRLLWHNREAAYACAIWIHGEREGRALRVNAGTFVLPAQLQAVCLSMLNGWPGRRHRPGRRTLTDLATGMHVQVRMILCGKERVPAFYLHLDYRRPRGDRERPLSPAALSRYSRLSRSEREVALLVRDGLSNLEIARALSRSAMTIKTQMGSIFRKLEIKGRARVAVMLNR